MFEWLNGEGAALKQHIPGRTNYLTDLKNRNRASSAGEDGDSSAGGNVEGKGGNRPFPLNPYFVSEPILSEELRNAIYEKVVVQKQDVRTVSAQMHVDMRRVAAVVRLVELEKRWRAQGKPLALPYARAIHEMVPTTPLAKDGQRQPPHESINDLPVNRLTDPQIFYPVSESRQFTRVDAGRVFSGAPAMEHGKDKIERPEELAMNVDPKELERVGKGENEQQVLLPADARIPHPQMISFERDKLENPGEAAQRRARHEERLRKYAEVEMARKRRLKELEEKRTMKVQPDGARFEYRFKDVVVSKETVGEDGRGHAAPGHRYGVPHEDRKRGQVKIPTKVEV
ncbi:hypothetical protein VTN49DRAFT_5040 [Thermomyces lanuginosus]|uniref:mitochondrial 37S ribosomal protein mS45 n=1 Tax=Thermomyces lanuginosus TaxID=5541 RepID=UPI0037449351